MCALHPISARRRAVALRPPCAEMSWHPASSQRSRNQLPKPAGLKGLPKFVTRKVFTPSVGVESMISRSFGCIGISRCAPSPPSVLPWSTVSNICAVSQHSQRARAKAAAASPTVLVHVATVNVNDVNPWSKQHWNLTHQGQIYRQDQPEANRLAQA